MKPKKLILWLPLAFIALVTGIIAVSFAPSVLHGIRERKALEQLQATGAPLSAYRDLLGRPEGEYDSFESYRSQYGQRALTLPKDKVTAGRFLYWAKESLPYYYVLIIAEAEDSPPLWVHTVRAGQQ